MTVFIGGSRAVSKLNAVIREKLDDLMARGCTILVGDASGADKAAQQHFADRGYRDVVVYCMDNCRNNLGAWPARQISWPGAQRDFAYYAAKDLAMAEGAQCGVMLWDGKSKGTLNNVQNLMGAGKKVLVYFTPEQAFHKLSSERDLVELLQRCDKTAISAAQQQIRRKIFNPIVQPAAVQFGDPAKPRQSEPY
jgi:hypothetical protein